MNRRYGARYQPHRTAPWEGWMAPVEFSTGQQAPRHCECGHFDVAGYRQRKSGGGYRVLCWACGEAAQSS